MFYRNNRAARRFAASLIIAFLVTVAVSAHFLWMAQTTRPSLPPPAAAFFHDDDEKPNKGLTREQRAREAWAWHKANQQRIEQQTDTQLTAALAPEDVSQDINDIAVIQGDVRVVTLPRAFDLTGRSVTFTPSGAGYTISSGASSFDTSIGVRRDLTAAPAVNPKPETEPGDDAYILENLGFNFSYFGQSFSSVALTSNGNLVFRPAGISQDDFNDNAVISIASLTDFQGGLPRIAPYWHDLDARAASVGGSNGVFMRQAADRIVATWNNVRDFPNNPAVDNGLHRFQVTLFANGQIVFNYQTAQLTSQALAGITPGRTQNTTTLVDLTLPPANVITNPIGEFFSTSTRVDVPAAVKAFYDSHPNRDVYDFVYLLSDFDSDLGDAFAFYLPIRNDAQGIGLGIADPDTTATLGSRKIQGVLNLSNIATQYPEYPTARFLGANHALSIMGQEQGHRWLAFPQFPGDAALLLGRDDAHWSFFMNIESTISSPAARRSSSAEGNVWRDNGNGTFTTVNLIDGFSRLDQYLMGLRPAGDVPETFVIANPSGTSRNRGSNPAPNVTVNGTKQAVTINQIIQANGARTPDFNTAQKNFRAAILLLVRQGTQPAQATLNKVARYRLAWESYFKQSTEGLAAINTGLADQAVARDIAPASAASYKSTLAPGEITALFGAGMAGGTAIATTQPLPTTLGGVQALVNGSAAPLFFVSPGQINFQVPRATASTTINPSAPSATATIEVFNNGTLIRAGAFQIAPNVPAVFTLNQSGTGAAAAVDAILGGREPFNAKQANGQPNIIAVFGTGLGSDATDVDGNVNASVQATIDGAAVTVNYAGRAPGFTGLNQLNVVFPANITSGTHNLVISRNGIQGRQVTIAVR